MACGSAVALIAVASSTAVDSTVRRGRIAYAQGIGISVMRADGTHNRRLTRKGSDRAPAWSPDGRRIAFVRYGSDGYGSVYLIGTNGRGLRRLLNRTYAPQWSPNGRQLAVGATLDRRQEIDIVNPDGSNRHRLAGDGFSATWSPNGTQLAYAGETIDPDSGEITGGFLAVVNADGTGKQVIFTTPHKGMPYEPVWSPDGREIAFKREFFDGGPGEIWVVQPDGGGPRKVTGNGEHPSWAPDSRSIVYAGFKAGGEYGIYVVRLDGTHRAAINAHCPKRRVCGGGADPAWHR